MNSEEKRIKHSPDNLLIVDELILQHESEKKTETLKFQKHLKVSEYSGKLRLLMCVAVFEETFWI